MVWITAIISVPPSFQKRVHKMNVTEVELQLEFSKDKGHLLIAISQDRESGPQFPCDLCTLFTFAQWFRFLSLIISRNGVL